MDGQPDIIEPQDDLEVLEDGFSRAQPGVPVKARIVFDPDNQPAALPDLVLKRNVDVYEQLVAHIRAQSGARPGEYRVRLTQGRGLLVNVRLNLLFAPGEATAAASAAPAREDNPDPYRNLGAEIARAAQEATLQRVRAQLFPPSEPAAEEAEEEDEDEEYDEPRSGFGAIVDRVLDNEDVQGMLGDFFEGVTSKTRAEAKLIEAKARALDVETEFGRRKLGELLKSLEPKEGTPATVVHLKQVGGK